MSKKKTKKTHPGKAKKAKSTLPTQEREKPEHTKNPLHALGSFSM